MSATERVRAWVDYIDQFGTQQTRKDKSQVDADLTAIEQALTEAREALRGNIGDAYNLLTQGESPTQLRGPSAQRIYDRSRTALAKLDALAPEPEGGE